MNNTVNSLGRKLLSYYRSFQYKLCRRDKYGVMRPGSQVFIEHFRYEENHGDVVHPCVRYIHDGFEGHKWWMVYTPYYKSNAALENPILCYSENDNPDEPPTTWKFYCLVNEKPSDGYNSDPTLLYANNRLYVYWRENIVENKERYNYWRATFVAQVGGGKVVKCSDKPILQTGDDEIDAETCPTFVWENDGSFTAYAMHLQFHSKRVKRLGAGVKKIVNSLFLVFDLLGFYSQQKHFGLAIWKGSSPEAPFRHTQTVGFHNCNKLYRPWHMDFFDWEGKRYCIVQTNMGNADLCLSVSEDDENFSLYKKPLITNETIKKIGIYKPCAGVTPEGTFYLYYTAQDPEDRSLNKLYLTKMSFSELLDKIK